MFSRRSTVVRENCSLQCSGMEDMEDFRVETLKAVWQAFDSLDTDRKGLVHVSQLKVITSNIGLKMGIDKGETLLNQEGALSMDFNSYFNIVKTGLVDKVEQSETPGRKSIGECLNSIIKTCWTFCNFERLHKSKWLSFEHCLVLWRLFNFLSETDEAGEPILPVQLHMEEANMLLKKFVDETGQKNKEDIIKASLSELSGECMCFADFLNVFEKECVTSLSKSDITHGLNHLQDTYILNILGKGMLWKKGYKVKNWKERWFVMTSREIKYYVSSNEKQLKGVIDIDGDCTVELMPDRVGHKPNRFVIHTKKKPYEMSASDMKTKNEWVSGLGMAFHLVGKDTNVQKEAARQRGRARTETRRRLAEEEKRRREEAEFMRQQKGELDEERRRRLQDEELLRKRVAELEEERRLREEAEARAREEQALKEAEQQKLRELEEIRRQLEQLLEEERQAKRDEEIVRSLQARILDEEFQRREELEVLKQKQEELLKTERQQNALLESDREAQERELRDAQLRLQALERERQDADNKMREATEKLQRAEKDRQIMEEKVKLWKTPVGLARPIMPTANPFVTHRGQGAFCDKDFVSRDKPTSETGEVKNDGLGANGTKAVKGQEADKQNKSVAENDDGNTDNDILEKQNMNEQNKSETDNGNSDKENDNGEKQEIDEQNISEKDKKDSDEESDGDNHADTAGDADINTVDKTDDDSTNGEMSLGSNEKDALKFSEKPDENGAGVNEVDATKPHTAEQSEDVHAEMENHSDKEPQTEDKPECSRHSQDAQQNEITLDDNQNHTAPSDDIVAEQKCGDIPTQPSDEEPSKDIVQNDVNENKPDVNNDIKGDN